MLLSNSLLFAPFLILSTLSLPSKAPMVIEFHHEDSNTIRLSSTNVSESEFALPIRPTRNPQPIGTPVTGNDAGPSSRIAHKPSQVPRFPPKSLMTNWSDPYATSTPTALETIVVPGTPTPDLYPRYGCRGRCNIYHCVFYCTSPWSRKTCKWHCNNEG